jgi:Domain of unknown function DUF11/HYR domain
MKALDRLATKSKFLINRRTLRNSLLILLPAMVAASFIAPSSARRSEQRNSELGSGNAQALIGGRSNAQPRNSAPQKIFGAGSGLTPWSFMLPQQPPSPEAVATYTTDNQGNCTNTLANQFTTGDTVCARASNLSTGPRGIYWVNPDAQVVQVDTVTAASLTSKRTVSQRGEWHVYLVDEGDGSARAVSAFSVSDPQNPAVDLSIVKGSGDGTYTAGGFARYTIVVTNNGPDTASSVSLSESTPNNTSFTGVTPDAAFTCTPGSPTVCTATSMAAGTTAIFTFVYTVSPTAPVGTVIQNTASVTSSTTELNPADNTTTIAGTVTSTGGGTNTCSVACPDDITTQANTVDQNNNPGAVVHFSPPSGNDECGVITVDHCNDCFFPVGQTTVTATATTGDKCSFVVTVTPPSTGGTTISCPANQSGNADANCKASFSLGTATATGTNVTLYALRSDGELVYNCDDFGNCTRTSSDAPFTYGVTTITWYAFSHDIAGPYNAQTGDEESRRTGSASCTQTITVNDVTAPTIAATDQSASADANCQAPVPDYSSTVSDNCSSNITYTQTPAAGTLVGLGPHTVHIEANDNSSNNNGAGNSATKDVTFTVNDTTAPVITCPANITRSNDPGQCSAIVNPGTATATDNCDSNPTISGTRSDNQSLSAPYPKGTTTITWTAIDHSGNLSSCQQTVTVNDTENPTITAPPNVTANTGPGRTTCDADVSNATLGTASANDNCPGVTVSRSPSGNTFPVGTTTITWTATDTSGNTATATQTVTVNDNTPPVVTPPANVTAYTGPGATSCGTFVSDSTLGTASATDNCPGVSGVTRSGVPSGNFFPVGTTTITYSATDAHGNSSSATQTVTVIDNTPPVISCPSSQTLEPTCPSGAVGNWTAPVGTDNCPGAVTTRTAGPAPGTVFAIGTTTTITYTVNDAAGNSTSCSFTITVKTVTQTIEDLKTSVNNSSLDPPTKGGLVSKLQAAEDALAAGHTNTACQKLADFINSTQNLIDHGNISAATGNAWISTATHLRNAIGCTNNPCS